jgi:hypothetical protein
MSFSSESGDERMVSLRQRSRSNVEYSRVNTDDEDDIPLLISKKAKFAVKNTSNTGKLILSVFIIIFLRFLHAGTGYQAQNSVLFFQF